MRKEWCVTCDAEWDHGHWTADDWTARSSTPPVNPCRQVPMRLIHDNEETVDREALVVALDGQDVIQNEQWQSYHADVLAEVMEPEDLQEWYSHLIAFDLILAAARLALDGETP